MSKTYLKAEAIVNLWSLYKKGMSNTQIANKLNISSTTVATWVRDVTSMLNGQKVERTTGMTDLTQAITIIKNNSINGRGIKSDAMKKLLQALDEYVEERVGERFNRLSKMFQ